MIVVKISKLIGDFEATCRNKNSLGDKTWTDSQVVRDNEILAKNEKGILSNYQESPRHKVSFLFKDENHVLHWSENTKEQYPDDSDINFRRYCTLECVGIFRLVIHACVA